MSRLSYAARVPFALIAWALLLLNSPAAAAAKPETVSLPYQLGQPDANGNQYFIYQNGWIQQQGNMPIYGELATPIVNGQQFNAQINQARLEENGDVVLDNIQFGAVTLTRRIQYGREDGYLRIVDVFKNTQNRETTLNLSFRTTINFGMQADQAIQETKKKTTVACSIRDGQGREVLEMYGGKGAKVLPTSVGQQNRRWISAVIPITIAVGKEVALMHFHGTSANAEASAKFVTTSKASKLMGDIPRAIRALIVNFVASQSLLGDDTELLRGDTFDCVELRTGDQIKGTLKDASYKVHTTYGTVEVPADKVAGLLCFGQSQPRQLVVTVDGEIYGGRIDSPGVNMQMSNGQNTLLPLSQVSRVGYRRRPSESEELVMDKPMLFLRSGERIFIGLPEADIPLATRFGPLQLASKAVSSINFQGEDGVTLHQVTLNDGSRFGGLVTTDAIEVAVRAAAGQAVRFPIATVGRLVLSPRVDDVDDTAALLQLGGDDALVASLTGQLKLQTSFDTLTLDARQIKTLVRARAAYACAEAQVTLWDDTTLNGLLLSPMLDCQLRCGINLRVAMPLVTNYLQPAAQPSQTVVDRVKQIVAELNNDDWKQRDHAQAQLQAMGPVIASVLRQLRPDQPPESQQRIDLLLNQFKPAAGPAPAGHTPPGLPGMQQGMMIDN